MFKDIVAKVLEDVKYNSPSTLFQLYGYNGNSLIELHTSAGFDSDTKKESISKALRTQIVMEKPDYVISVCIGVMKPLNLSQTKKKKDKRDVLIICIENSEGLYEIQNLYINRAGKKIKGFSPAWSYDSKTIKENDFSISGVLCSWYQSLEDVYEYIEEGNRKAQSMRYN
jgi:hypothetical protein